MSKTIIPPKAPNLPVGPVEYEQSYQNQLNNVQRLYYNQVDNYLTSVMENSGGRFINFPHLFMSDSVSQYAAADNTPTIVQWNTIERNEGFTFASNTATATYSGAYKIDYRLLFENSDSALHEAWVWATLNGTPVARSGTKFSVPASTTADGYVMAVGTIVLDMVGADQLQLYWATDKYGNAAGSVLGVYIEAYPAQVSPYVRPAIPSAYGSITFVSELSQ